MESSCLIPVEDATSHCAITKPNYLKLTGINLLAFGLELCASAGFTYIPPIMLKNGFSDKTLTIVMGIGPCISLLLVPIIGRWSDKCQSRFGRRRPFMLALGIVMIISLLMIPFSGEIFTYFKIMSPSMGIATGVILLDFSSQSLMNPCKALIPDIFHSIEEQNSGFTMYSCMLSLGGCLGYFITSLNWTSTFLGDLFGGQEKAVFSLLAILLIFLLVVNLSVAQEKPFVTRVSRFPADIKLDKNSNDFKLSTNAVFEANTDISEMPQIKNSFTPLIKMNSFSTQEKICMHFTPKMDYKDVIFSWFSWMKNSIYGNFQEFLSMPPVLVRLFIACLFGWMGLMVHDMYYTDFVGQVIYRGKPQAEKASIAFNLYDEGVRMGSWGLLLHCLAAALYAAFVQQNLIDKYGKCKVYLFGMILLTLSLLGTVITKNIILVNLCSGLSGLGLAAITTVPYSLITEYYSKKEVYYKSNQQRGVGEDMAVLDSAVFLSQIIPSLFLGYIVEYTKTSATYMIVAATCSAVACYFSYFVTFTS